MPHKCTNCGRTFADGSKEMLSGCPDCGGNKFQFQPSGSMSSPSETKASDSTDSSADTPTSADASTAANASPGGDTSTATDTSSATDASSATDNQSTASAVGRATSTVKGWVGSRNRSESSNADRDERPQNRKQSARKRTATQSDPKQTSSERKTRKQSASEQAAKQSATKPATGKKERQSQSSAPAQSSSPQRPPADSSEDRAQASARSEVVPEDELPNHSDGDETGTVIEPPEDDQPSLDELREELNSQFESIKVVEPGQYELNLMELYERDEYIIAMRENGRYVIQVPDSWTGAADS